MRTAYNVDLGKEVTAKVGTCFACGCVLEHESHQLFTQDRRKLDRYNVHAEWCSECRPHVFGEFRTVRWAE